MDDFLLRPIDSLKGVGSYYVKRLAKLGITDVGELLRHFPKRYEDFSTFVTISDIRQPGTYSVLCRVEAIKTRKSFRRRLFVIDARVSDDTGSMNVVWFGQSYLARSIPQQSVVALSGRVVRKDNHLSFQGPVYEVVSRDAEHLSDVSLANLKHAAGLVPVYGETHGLTSRGIRFIVKPLLEHAKNIKDFMPAAVRRLAGVMELGPALEQIHFPETQGMADRAKQRFAFEELFLLQTVLLSQRKRNQELCAPDIPSDIEFVKKILGQLPYELTKTQKQAAWDIMKDIARPYPMNRLLSGDVGSGKTIVAALAVALTVKAGHQAVMLTPTEILARQHFEKLSDLFSVFNIPSALLVAKEARIRTDDLEGAVSRPALNAMLEQGKPLALIGTHAVLQKTVHPAGVGLVVVDEQHRFGIRQRAQLLGSGQATAPHFLSMSATPIPRTLALALWGDLDISAIQEMPKGRKPIESKVVEESGRRDLYAFVRAQIQLGRQAFVICPRIEEPEEYVTDDEYAKLDAKAVKKEYERLKTDVFPDLRLGLLHGKLRPNEKESAMADFARGKTDIIVSTSVIEVGIDVPNASVMVIENADSFGLAQLHQFRGRVGRGEHQSYCFLLSGSQTQTSKKRLEDFAKTFDGFKLAEQDLSDRGPGEFLGTRQSGIPDLAMHSLKNIELILLAKRCAQSVLKKSETLDAFPLLKERVREFRQEVHLE